MLYSYFEINVFGMWTVTDIDNIMTYHIINFSLEYEDESSL